MALGRQFGKRVIGLAGRRGSTASSTVDDAPAALARVAEVVLGL